MNSVKEQPTVRLMNAVHGEVLMPVVGLGTGGYGQPDGWGGEYWGPEEGHHFFLSHFVHNNADELFFLRQ